MMSRFQPVQVFHLVCMFIVVSGGFLASGYSFAQTYDWLAADGPEGGQVWAMGRAPNGDVYAGLWRPGGIFRSTDDGLTWQERGLEYTRVTRIIFNNAGVIFAASGSDVQRSSNQGADWELLGWGLVGNYGGIAYDPDLDILYTARWEQCFRSLDGGDSWDEVDTDFPAAEVRCLVAVPNGGPLFVGTNYDKVFRSDDGGVTWTPFADGIGANGVMDILLEANGDLFAASYGGGIYRNTVNGSAWSGTSTGLTDFFCYSIARDEGPGRLYVGTTSAGICYSGDDGFTWTAGNDGLGLQEVRDLIPLSGPTMLAATYGGGIFRTVDTGVWEPSHEGISHTHISSLLLAGFGTLFASTDGGGVHRSLDGGATWTPANEGIEDPDVFDLAEHPDGDLFCGTWMTHVYRSTDDGDTWNRTGSDPSISRVSCLAVKTSTGDLFAGGLFGGGVWRSPDKGDSWVSAAGGLPDGDTNQLVVEDDGDLLVVVYDNGIYRSVNDGDTWEAINGDLPALNVRRVLSLPGGVLFAAIPYAGLYRSLDDGVSWQLADASLDDLRANCVAANSDGSVFAGMADDGLIYRSFDGGDTWALILGSGYDSPIGCLGFNDSGQLLAGTHGFGVVYTAQTTPVVLHGLAAERSSNAGGVTIRWSVRSGDVMFVYDLYRSVTGGHRENVFSEIRSGSELFEFIDSDAPTEPCDYWLRVTDSSGTPSWYGPVSVDKAAPVISRLAIESVWPNPAPGSTTVRFSVPMNQTARLDVYDLRGRLVRRLRQTAGGPGSLEAVWDARNDSGVRVPSGTYFLRLSTDNKVVTGKMVVLGRGR